jgi:hypothetical protein
MSRNVADRQQHVWMIDKTAKISEPPERDILACVVLYFLYVLASSVGVSHRLYRSPQLMLRGWQRCSGRRFRPTEHG